MERRYRLTLGRHMEVICLPVHSGRGLRMAGTGSWPLKESRCITRFMTMSRSRKVSRLVQRCGGGVEVQRCSGVEVQRCGGAAVWR